MKPAAARRAAALVTPLALTFSGLVACAPAERPSTRPIFIAAEAGYLTAGALERLAKTAPPAPLAGSSQDRDDRVESARFAALEDSDRWLLATAHAELRPPLALQHFDCALEVRLGSAETPALDRMAARAFHDVRAAVELAAMRQTAAGAARALPAADPGRRACQVLTPAARGVSYPSAAAATGAAYAELLAAIQPDRAAAVRRVGNEIGVSRLVCAMNYPSGVTAGESLGRAVMTEIAATPEFRAEATEVRRELEAARATGRTNPGCAAERAALAQTTPAALSASRP